MLQTVGRCLALLFVLVATRVVAPSQFGRYSIVAGLVAFAGFIADFGSTTVITRMVSREPKSSDELLSQTLVASVVVGLVAYWSVIVYLAIGPYSSSLLVAGLIGGLAIPLKRRADVDARRTRWPRPHRTATAIVTFVRLASSGRRRNRRSGDGQDRAAISAMAVGPMVGCVLAAILTRHYRVEPGGSALTSVVHSPSSGWRRPTRCSGASGQWLAPGPAGAVVVRGSGEVAQYDLALRAIEASTALGMVIGGPALYIMSGRLGSADIDGCSVRTPTPFASRISRESLRRACSSHCTNPSHASRWESVTAGAPYC